MSSFVVKYSLSATHPSLLALQLFTKQSIQVVMLLRRDIRCFVQIGKFQQHHCQRYFGMCFPLLILFWTFKISEVDGQWDKGLCSQLGPFHHNSWVAGLEGKRSLDAEPGGFDIPFMWCQLSQGTTDVISTIWLLTMGLKWLRSPWSQQSTTILSIQANVASDSTLKTSWQWRRSFDKMNAPHNS